MILGMHGGAESYRLPSFNKEKPEQCGTHDKDVREGLNMSSLYWSVVLKKDHQTNSISTTCWKNKYFRPHPKCPAICFN